MDEKRKSKRWAAHWVHLPGRGFMKQQMVELADGKLQVSSLVEETEDVEWYPGVLFFFLDEDSREWRVEWAYPFDLIRLMPVSGTQRRRLL